MNKRHTARIARRIVGAALLAVLLAQWAALVHTVLHGPVHAGVVIQGHAAESSNHAAGSPVCQLFDHLLVAQTGGGKQPQVAGPQWSTAVPPWALLPALHCQAVQGYEARGPPQA